MNLTSRVVQKRKDSIASESIESILIARRLIVVRRRRSLDGFVMPIDAILILEPFPYSCCSDENAES